MVYSKKAEFWHRTGWAERISTSCTAGLSFSGVIRKKKIGGIGWRGDSSGWTASKRAPRQWSEPPRLGSQDVGHSYHGQDE